MTPRLAPSTFALRRAAAQQRSRAWLGPVCVAVSLGAHAALLALVVPSPNAETPPTDVPPKESATLDDIAVTVLPKPVAPATAPASDLAQAPAMAPAAQLAPVTQPVPTVQSVSPPAAIAPVESQPAPLIVATPDPFTPPPPPPSAEPEAPVPYANFPHLAGAQATCEGIADCWRSPVSNSWRGAASALEEQLAAQGYTLNNVTGEVLSIDSGVRVYAVSKPGEASYYLNLVSVRDGVLYTMTAEPMTSDQVLTLQQS